MKIISKNLKKTIYDDNIIGGTISCNLQSDIVNLLNDKGAEDINLINLKDKSDIADYMIICTGNSTVQVGSLAGYVQKYLKEKNINVSIEGNPHNNWVIIDSPYVVTHIFRQETRELYQLDKMWG